MKLNEYPNFQLPAPVLQWMRDVAIKVNGLAAGAIFARDQVFAGPPTTGTWQQGDFIANPAPTELGSPGSKYVVEGWVCVVAGTPGTWVQKRFLTGA